MTRTYVFNIGNASLECRRHFGLDDEIMVVCVLDNQTRMPVLMSFDGRVIKRGLPYWNDFLAMFLEATA